MKRLVLVVVIVVLEGCTWISCPAPDGASVRYLTLFQEKEIEAKKPGLKVGRWGRVKVGAWKL